MRRTFVALVLSIAALAGPSHAEELTRAVPVTAADLRDEAAAERLYQRVQIAAESLCDKANPALIGHPWPAMAARRACVRTAMDRAFMTAGSPTLAAVHARKQAETPDLARTRTLAAR